MQSASDMFLGWTLGRHGRYSYVRQLRDMKISAAIDDMDTDALRLDSRSLLRQTLDRTALRVPSERTVVVTMESHAPYLIRERRFATSRIFWASRRTGAPPPRCSCPPTGFVPGTPMPSWRCSRPTTSSSKRTASCGTSKRSRASSLDTPSRWSCSGSSRRTGDRLRLDSSRRAAGMGRQPSAPDRPLPGKAVDRDSAHAFFRRLAVEHLCACGASRHPRRSGTGVRAAAARSPGGNGRVRRKPG